jgi:hypothetical protein
MEYLIVGVFLLVVVICCFSCCSLLTRPPKNGEVRQEGGQLQVFTKGQGWTCLDGEYGNSAIEPVLDSLAKQIKELNEFTGLKKRVGSGNGLFEISLPTPLRDRIIFWERKFRALESLLGVEMKHIDETDKYVKIKKGK